LFKVEGKRKKAKGERLREKRRGRIVKGIE